MQNKFKQKFSLLIVLLLAISLNSFADNAKKDINLQKIGEELKELEFLKGDAKGDINTEGTLKREHALVVISRLMGKEKEASQFDGVSKFSDIDNNYYKPFASFAIQKGWLTGRTESLFGFGDEITADEFYALILRALGYSEFKGEKFKEVPVKASELGLSNNVEKNGKQKLKRGDAFLIIKNSLSIDIKDDKLNRNLYEFLKLKDFTAKNENIIIMHTNDMHGFFNEGKYDGMGAAKVSRFVNLVKANNEDAIYVDAGDAIQGSNLVTLSRGEAAIKIMNTMHLELMTLGNHEFDYGTKRLNELEKLANFEFLAGNVTNEKNEALYKPYLIKKIKGYNIGFIGIDTPETLYKSHPENTKGIKFQSPVEFARKMAEELSGKVDAIVAVVHLGDEVGKDDFTSTKLANEVPEIDVIIDGHSHSTYKEGKLVNDVLIASAGEKTKHVGFIEINPKKTLEKKARLFSKKYANYIKNDEKTFSVTNKIKESNEKILKEVIANLPFDLDGSREVVRKGESNLGNLLTEALLDVSKADFVLVNGGGIRSSISKGEITKGDILSTFPFGNTVRVLELTGKDVKLALEHGVKKYPELNGGFPHLAGLKFKFDPKKEEGNRITEVLLSNNTKLDEKKTYKLATNDFLSAGGDGYDILKDKKVVGEFGAMDEILIKYIKEKGFDKAKLDKRVIVVNEEKKSE